MALTKLIIVGGFLGAGKTTLLNASSRLLQKEGYKVGLITNDQASGLVDTHILSTSGTSVREIAGSCFCCNFDGLMEAAFYLKDIEQCNVIIAEPVGSCTDLSATLLQPIKSNYQAHFELAPLSVMVDPFRLQEMLKCGQSLREESAYIYRKQIEEADYLVMNKIDLLELAEKKKIQSLLQEEFPGYSLHTISALCEQGIHSWLNTVLTDKQAGRRIAKVDYGKYAKGEALMGWYNATFIIEHKNRFLIPWAEFNLKFLSLIQDVLQYEKISIGHLKTFLKNGTTFLMANLTGTDREIKVQGTPFSSLSAKFVVNIRAETTPELLKEIIEEIIDAYDDNEIQFETIDLKYLSPSKPIPTYRYSNVI